MSLEFSIAMPVFNSIKTIEQSINSLIFQTYSNWKLIVIDNHSNDGTFEFIYNLSKFEKRIIIHRNEQNIGMSNNFQLAVKKAVELKSDFVGILLSDEFYELNFLEKMSFYASKLPEIDFINSGHIQLFEGGEKTTACFFQETILMPKYEYCKLALRTAHMYIGCTFFRPVCFSFLNGFNSNYKYFFDTDFLLRLTKNFKGIYISYALLNRRMDSMNFISAVQTKRAIVEEYLSRLNIIEDLCTDLSSEASLQINMDFNFYMYRLCMRYSDSLDEGTLKNEYLNLSVLLGKDLKTKNFVPGKQPFPVEEKYKLILK